MNNCIDIKAWNNIKLNYIDKHIVAQWRHMAT